MLKNVQLCKHGSNKNAPEFMDEVQIGYPKKKKKDWNFWFCKRYAPIYVRTFPLEREHISNIQGLKRGNK